MDWNALMAQSYARLSAGDAHSAEVILTPAWASGAARPPRALLLMGIIQRAIGRLDEAERLLSEAVATAPSDHEAHHNLGNLYLGQKRYQEAERAYAETLRLAPRTDTARFGRARALNGLDRHAEAEQEVTVLLAQSRTVENLRVYAHALGGLERHQAALAIIDELLKVQPSDEGARFDRAVALRKLKRRSEAFAEVESLIRDGVETAALMHLAALLHVDLGEVAEAEAWLVRGVAAYPTHGALARELAHLLWMRGGSLDEAAGVLRRAIALEPKDVELNLALADLLSRAGKFADAESVVRMALSAGAPMEKVVKALAAALDEQGRSHEAADLMRAAMSTNSNADARSVLAHSLMRDGEAAEALHHIRLALSQAPKDQLWWSYFAIAQRQLGDPSFARLYDMERFVHPVDITPPPPFGDPVAFNAVLAERLDRLHVLEQHPLGQTLRNGTQTPRDLTEVEDDVIQAFLASVRAAVSAFAVSLPHDPTHPFLNRNPKGVEFSGSWSVRLKPGGNHFNHVHPMGWISSAYYVRLPKREPDDPPHAGWIKFGEPRLPIPGCTPLKWVEPKVGRLVLFPSYMWHGTEPFFRDDRLTCAFDFVPT